MRPSVVRLSLCSRAMCASVARLLRCLRAMRASVVIVLVAACAEPEPSFGDPSGIVGKRLPNETVAGGDADFGGPYVATANRPATTMAAAHAARGGPAPSDLLDCLSCHREGGAAPGKPFAFGGRVANGAPVADVDVVVLLGTSRVGPVKSDVDGFFWVAGPGVSGDARAIIRDATTRSAMGSAVGDGGGSCDRAGCHVIGGQGKVGRGL